MTLKQRMYIHISMRRLKGLLQAFNTKQYSFLQKDISGALNYLQKALDIDADND